MVKIENSNLEVYGIIYLIRNKVNGKCYVGQTCQDNGFDGRYNHLGEGIERVYNHHKSLKEHNRSHNKHLLSSIEKYGLKAFEVNKCLDYAFSLEELNIKEKVYIQLYNSFKNGYNETLGGEGMEGYSFSEEDKQKMSEAKKGENNPMHNKHHTKETKQKMSEIKKGKNHPFYGKHFSVETRQKMSEAKKGENHPLYGKCLSDETKQKLSKAKKGENHPMYGKHHTKETKTKMSEALKGENNPKAKAVYCYEKNEIRLTVKEWADELCLDKTCISACCRGKQKSTGGYHFRYATEKEIEDYKQKIK